MFPDDFSHLKILFYVPSRIPNRGKWLTRRFDSSSLSFSTAQNLSVSFNANVRALSRRGDAKMVVHD